MKNSQRKYNKWFEFSLEIKKDIIKDIKDFRPVNFNNKNNGGLDLMKIINQNNVFSKNNISLQLNNSIPSIGQIVGKNGEGEILNNKIPLEIVPKQNQSGKNINIKITKKLFISLNKKIN